MDTPERVAKIHSEGTYSRTPPLANELLFIAELQRQSGKEHCPRCPRGTPIGVREFLGPLSYGTPPFAHELLFNAELQRQSGREHFPQSSRDTPIGVP